MIPAAVRIKSIKSKSSLNILTHSFFSNGYITR